MFFISSINAAPLVGTFAYWQFRSFVMHTLHGRKVNKNHANKRKKKCEEIVFPVFCYCHDKKVPIVAKI